MVSERRGSGFNPEAQINPYAQIPNLVRGAIVLRPDRARRSKRELIKQIVADPYSDPLALAVAEAQDVLISARELRQMRNAKELLGEIIHQGAGADTPREEFVFRVNQQMANTFLRIEQNNRTIQEKNYLKRDLSDDYRMIMDSIIQLRKNIGEGRLRPGINEVSLIQVGRGLNQDQLGKLQEEITAHNQWRISISGVTDTVRTDLIAFNTVARDSLIDQLKSEPEFTIGMDEKKLYTEKHAGISLEDIEKMNYPVSVEEWSKITDYVNAVRLSMRSNPSLTGKAGIIAILFFNSTLFNQDIVYRNSRILANINSWQELLSYYLLFKQSDEIDSQITSLVQNTGDDVKFAPFIAEAARGPFILDPGTEDEMLEDLPKRHPLFASAMSYQFDHYGREIFESGEHDFIETSEKFFREVVLPQLKIRALSLGLSDRFDKELSQLEGDVLAEGHFKFIKAVFEKNCGLEYLEKLQVHSQEIEEITINAWQDAIERMHFLPMQGGENIIEFSEGSVPNMQGLESIMMTTVGSPQDWRIHVAFKPLNIPFEVHAYLTQEGKLDFLNPLQREIPGLYTMLNHIAVLTFHDLVVQEKKEREGGSRILTRQLIQQEPQLSSLEKEIEDVQSRRSQARNLPRVQRDRQLIADVYEATNREPRKVELHDRFLPGAGEYQAAVELYQEAITGRVSEETIYWTRTQLEEVRKKAFRISEEKRLSMPAKFQLPAIKDPITGEMRYLKTWVIEHSNPKPTPEELRSPLKLYERYYKNSSALASLDQMKPWFVGQ